MDALEASNVTDSGSVSLTSPTFGYIAIVVCAFGFGTNYLPVKKFNMGDGKSNSITLVPLLTWKKSDYMP